MVALCDMSIHQVLNCATKADFNAFIGIDPFLTTSSQGKRETMLQTTPQAKPQVFRVLSKTLGDLYFTAAADRKDAKEELNEIVCEFNRDDSSDFEFPNLFTLKDFAASMNFKPVDAHYALNYPIQTLSVSL